MKGLDRLRLIAKRADGAESPPVPLPDGDAGLLTTLHVMRELVQEAVLKQGSQASFTPEQVFGLIDKQRYPFVRDPARTEYLTSPIQVERTPGLGIDCDDRAMLGAYYLWRSRVSATFTVIGREPHGRWEHVCCSLGGTEWSIAHVPIDPQESARVGELPAHARRVVYDVRNGHVVPAWGKGAWNP